MSEALDKEWLADCEPHVLEKIDKWLLNPRVVTAIDIMVSARAEIRAQQLRNKILSDRLNELEREIESPWEEDQ